MKRYNQRCKIDTNKANTLIILQTYQPITNRSRQTKLEVYRKLPKIQGQPATLPQIKRISMLLRMICQFRKIVRVILQGRKDLASAIMIYIGPDSQCIGNLDFQRKKRSKQREISLKQRENKIRVQSKANFKQNQINNCLNNL